MAESALILAVEGLSFAERLHRAGVITARELLHGLSRKASRLGSAIRSSRGILGGARGHLRVVGGAARILGCRLCLIRQRRGGPRDVGRRLTQLGE